jgi:phosphopantetheine adenylyltransferase
MGITKYTIATIFGKRCILTHLIRASYCPLALLAGRFKMSEMFTVTVTKTELTILTAMVKQNLKATTNKQRRRVLGLLYDELYATLEMATLEAAKKRVQELQEAIAATAKAEKRKHLRVVK